MLVERNLRCRAHPLAGLFVQVKQPRHNLIPQDGLVHDGGNVFRLGVQVADPLGLDHHQRSAFADEFNRRLRSTGLESGLKAISAKSG